MKLLEQAGIIQGYTAIIDPAPLGLKVQAFVQVRLDAAHRREHRAVPARRRRMEEIVSCHAMTGNYDLLLQVVVPDLEPLSNVVLKKLMRIRLRARRAFEHRAQHDQALGAGAARPPRLMRRRSCA